MLRHKTDIPEAHHRRLKSFVRRNGRRTAAQDRARDALWPCFGMQIEDGMLDYTTVFERKAPCVLEIGFGSGQSLLALAKAEPDKNFIAIETHKPGIGALLLGMQEEALSNIRIYDADAVDVLEKCISDASLDAIQLFFPDPWQKRRHHPRRLIQAPFVKRLVQKLKPGGLLYLATDWEDYAKHMMTVLSAETDLRNLAGAGQYAERSPHRPILTKFERRALREGRLVREFCFEK